jgi:hypothetical protein
MNDNMDKQLDRLFADYREACPDFEGSASFTPHLWQRIDARRGFPLRIRRFAQVVVSASAVASLAMGLFLVTPLSQPNSSATYLEILDEEEQLHETLAYADVEQPDPAGDIQ